jgi:hypothetical protein
VDRNELIGQCSGLWITSATAARRAGTAPLAFPYSSMSRPPPSPKLRPSAQEQRIQREERRKVVRLRMAIWQELDARGITTPDDIGAALGMSAAEAHGLLTRRPRRASDVAALEAVVAQLGAQVPAPWRGRDDMAD